MLKDINKNIFQFIKFGLVGFSNTLISYGVYSILTLLGVPYVLSNIFGFIISVINSFYWNNKYVFKNEGSKKRNLFLTFIKTFIAYGTTGIVLSNILLVILVEKFNFSKFISPILILIVTIPLNFVINKYWSFRTSKEEGYDETKEN